MRFVNDLIVNAGDASADITSPAISMESLYGFAIQAVLTGAPNGSLKLQGSCDPGQGYPVGASSVGTAVTNWTDLSGTTTAIVAATTVLYNLDAVYYRWIRLVYTFSSGTGALSARLNAKGI